MGNRVIQFSDEVDLALVVIARRKKMSVRGMVADWIERDVEVQEEVVRMRGPVKMNEWESLKDNGSGTPPDHLLFSTTGVSEMQNRVDSVDKEVVIDGIADLVELQTGTAPSERKKRRKKGVAGIEFRDLSENLTENVPSYTEMVTNVLLAEEKPLDKFDVSPLMDIPE